MTSNNTKRKNNTATKTTRIGRGSWMGEEEDEETHEGGGDRRRRRWSRRRSRKRMKRRRRRKRKMTTRRRGEPSQFPRDDGPQVVCTAPAPVIDARRRRPPPPRLAGLIGSSGRESSCASSAACLLRLGSWPRPALLGAVLARSSERPWMSRSSAYLLSPAIVIRCAT
eukprot:7267030-Pyramimonas_sp.AAC.1